MRKCNYCNRKPQDIRNTVQIYEANYGMKWMCFDCLSERMAYLAEQHAEERVKQERQQRIAELEAELGRLKGE